MTTDQHLSLMERQGRANRLFAELLEGPPTARELAMQSERPNTPRERILRLLVDAILDGKE